MLGPQWNRLWIWLRGALLNLTVYLSPFHIPGTSRNDDAIYSTSSLLLCILEQGVASQSLIDRIHLSIGFGVYLGRSLVISVYWGEKDPQSGTIPFMVHHLILCGPRWLHSVTDTMHSGSEILAGTKFSELWRRKIQDEFFDSSTKIHRLTLIPDGLERVARKCYNFHCLCLLLSAIGLPGAGNRMLEEATQNLYHLAHLWWTLLSNEIELTGGDGHPGDWEKFSRVTCFGMIMLFFDSCFDGGPRWVVAGLNMETDRNGYKAFVVVFVHNFKSIKHVRKGLGNMECKLALTLLGQDQYAVAFHKKWNMLLSASRNKDFQSARKAWKYDFSADGPFCANAPQCLSDDPPHKEEVWCNSHWNECSTLTASYNEHPVLQLDRPSVVSVMIFDRAYHSKMLHDTAISMASVICATLAEANFGFTKCAVLIDFSTIPSSISAKTQEDLTNYLLPVYHSQMARLNFNVVLVRKIPINGFEYFYTLSSKWDLSTNFG
ncbi:hypothetical protein GYMLUDRAFT_245636 [Collybiopsis luxurians FD-317 M1]|uniref:Uncharacterized protein n=1 Tax=Collybiopsis luxurians FD-317 M1 TaxID=944289 RepID=A0A0D0BTS0_9AGAR|nr:hypothetical protein GYMLUDRAFT_245636 [Collybiopsis luxurians FD-317 M1]